MAARKALTEGVEPQLRNVKRVAAAFDGERDSLWVAEPPDPLRRLAANTFDCSWVAEPPDPLRRLAANTFDCSWVMEPFDPLRRLAAAPPPEGEESD